MSSIWLLRMETRLILIYQSVQIYVFISLGKITGFRITGLYDKWMLSFIRNSFLKYLYSFTFFGQYRRVTTLFLVFIILGVSMAMENYLTVIFNLYLYGD